jgi:hypothetical protein
LLRQRFGILPLPGLAVGLSLASPHRSGWRGFDEHSADSWSVSSAIPDDVIVPRNYIETPQGRENLHNTGFRNVKP